MLWPGARSHIRELWSQAPQIRTGESGALLAYGGRQQGHSLPCPWRTSPGPFCGHCSGTDGYDKEPWETSGSQIPVIKRDSETFLLSFPEPSYLTFGIEVVCSGKICCSQSLVSSSGSRRFSKSSFQPLERFSLVPQIQDWPGWPQLPMTSSRAYQGLKNA